MVMLFLMVLMKQDTEMTHAMRVQGVVWMTATHVNTVDTASDTRKSCHLFLGDLMYHKIELPRTYYCIEYSARTDVFIASHYDDILKLVQSLRLKYPDGVVSQLIPTAGITSAQTHYANWFIATGVVNIKT